MTDKQREKWPRPQKDTNEELWYLRGYEKARHEFFSQFQKPECPSDEEIEKLALNYTNGSYCCTLCGGCSLCFSVGAKQVRDNFSQKKLSEEQKHKLDTLEGVLNSWKKHNEPVAITYMEMEFLLEIARRK